MRMTTPNGNHMITLYYGPTPNGRKLSILLEEVALPYETIFVDTMAGDQHTPEFLKINPNNKMPALVDSDGPDGRSITLWESGAMMIYIAEKAGRFIPTDAHRRYQMLKWLMFQMGGLGPMGGQFAFFRFYARERVPMAIDRYTNEMLRQWRVMDGHLAKHDYFADEYSIADMAVYPWIWTLRRVLEKAGIAPEAQHLMRWFEQVGSRPAVQRGMEHLSQAVRKESIVGGLQSMPDATYSALYGTQQYATKTSA